MKKIVLIFALLFAYVTVVNSQQVYLKAGRSLSTLFYKNSAGHRVENILSSTHSNLGLGFRTNFFTNALFIKLGVNYNNYGAIASDDVVFNFMEWNATYMGADIGFDLNLFKMKNFTVFTNISTSLEFMVQGVQVHNNQVINIVGKEDFNTSVFFYGGGLGVEYAISDRVSVYTKYNYRKSSSMRKYPAKMKNLVHEFSFGLLLNVSKYKPTNIVGNSVESSIEISHLEKELEKTNKRLDALEENAKDVELLEKEIAAKDEEMTVLKKEISEALFEYTDKGITVNQRDGKIYVSMEPQLLFDTGSWKVKLEGWEAVIALGDVLANNQDIAVLIEGHTDNTPYIGGELIKDNWDLSTKRATAIIEILKNNTAINPYNLTAAGRAEFDPIASNETEEGKAKNRRIEFILSPNLEEVSKILNK